MSSNKDTRDNESLTPEETKSLIFKLYFYINQFKYYITPIFLAIYSLIYGFQFAFRTREAYRTSDIYVAISQFMDLRSYGIFLIVGGLCFAVSLFLENNIAKPTMTIGSFINFTLFLIYTIISLDTAGMQSTIMIHLTFSILNLFFFILSIVNMRVESIINGRK
ncbi:hypothetical protein [Staphylococcus phage vB_StaM_SA1]|nr:hypothetical protein [Staphylococcus phage vB_StaM_SA1]